MSGPTQVMTHDCIDAVPRPGAVYFDGAAGKWHLDCAADKLNGPAIVYCPWCGHQLEQSPVKATP